MCMHILFLFGNDIAVVQNVSCHSERSEETCSPPEGAKGNLANLAEGASLRPRLSAFAADAK